MNSFTIYGYIEIVLSHKVIESSIFVDAISGLQHIMFIVLWISDLHKLHNDLSENSWMLQ